MEATSGSSQRRLSEEIRGEGEGGKGTAANNFALNKLVLVERKKNPTYESLEERMEKLLGIWREKRKDYEKFY